MNCSNCGKLRNKIRQLESVIAILEEDLASAQSLQKQLDNANEKIVRINKVLSGIEEIPSQECSSRKWLKYRGYIVGDHCKTCKDMDGWEYNEQI